MSITDDQIGKNLTRLRGEMSQAELAERMRERGYKWSQATVWSVEKGERPLRLTEAEDIAAVLGVFASRLTDSDEISQLELLQHEVARANRELVAAIEKFHECQVQLMMTAELSAAALEGTNFATGIIDWLSLTAADIEKEVRIDALTTAQAENAKWAYLLSEEYGESAQEFLEDQEGDSTVLDGPFAVAFHKAWAELDGIRLVPQSTNVGGSGENQALDQEPAIPDIVEEQWGLAAHPKTDASEDHTP